MGKSYAMVLITALWLVSSVLDAGVCHEDRFRVEGKVYCDTCRIQFMTRVSKYMEGAKVRLECRSNEMDERSNVTFSGEAVTDKRGVYSIQVDGDHEEEICEVSLVKSSQDECAEISTVGFGHRARVSITGNNGIIDHVRHANPLGFMNKQVLSQCKEVLRELGFDEAGLLV